jgi:Tol biopolymer transport system component
VAGGDVNFGSLFSPDSSRILYVADQTTNDVLELFVSELSFGFPLTPVKLSGTLVAGGDVQFGLFSPDGSRVVYYADQQTNDEFELFSVPSVGGFPPIKLNTTPVPGGDVDFDDPQISPDGSRVIYRGDVLNDEVFELFSVPIGGGPSVRLNGTLVAGGNVDSSDFSFSPDGSRILYGADQIVDGTVELFVVPIAGGTPIKLSGPMVAGGNFSADSQDALFTPDGSRVIYLADQLTDGVDEVFSVPSSGGTTIRLNSPMVAGGDVEDDSIRVSPDSSRIIYVADQLIDEVNELFTVPVTGGTPVKLNHPLPPSANVDDEAEFSPDGSRVMYPVNSNDFTRRELYLVPSEGGAAVRINGELGPDGTVDFFDPIFTPDGNRILFIAKQQFDTVFEVYARVVRNRSLAGGGSWDNGANWEQDLVPDEAMQVMIDTASTIVASGSFYNRTVNELQLGGGPANSIFVLDDNASIHALNGITLSARGIIRGDGHVAGTLKGPSFGELRAGAGDHLRLSSPTFTNSGLISALGSGTSAAEIELDGAVINSASVGLIAGQHSVLRLAGGVTNQGSILLSGGANCIFGDINNQPGGSIIVAGGAAATFYDDVAQNGTLQVLKVGSTNSVATFAGSFTGSGGSTGGGDIFFLGDLRPGASPAIVSFANNIVFSGAATLNMEIGGTSPGAGYDQVIVNGHLALSGVLKVSLINDFIPAAGNTFNLLDWTTVGGVFTLLDLPVLSGGLTWITSGLYTNGVLSIAAGFPGDYNSDGKVDAADYVLWRNDPVSFGGQQGYGTWRANFGAAGSGAGAGAGANAAVPEPAMSVMLMLATAGLSFRRCWRRVTRRMA